MADAAAASEPTIDALPDACVALVLTHVADGRACCACASWARVFRGCADARVAALVARTDPPPPTGRRAREWLAALEAADAEFPGTVARVLTGCPDTVDRVTRAVSGGKLDGASTPLVIACHALMAGATRTAIALLRASRDASRYAPPKPYLIKAFYHCAASSPTGLHTLRAAWSAPERARSLRDSSAPPPQTSQTSTAAAGAIAIAGEERDDGRDDARGWARWRAHRVAHVALFEAAVGALQNQVGEDVAACSPAVLARVQGDVAWALGAFSRIIGASACWTALWTLAPTLTRAAVAPKVMSFTPHLAYVVGGIQDVMDVRALERSLGRETIALAMARAAPRLLRTAHAHPDVGAGRALRDRALAAMVSFRF